MGALVSISIIKQLGRIDTDAHNELLEFLRESAVEFVEDYCALSLTQKERVETVTPERLYVWLCYKPVISVSKIEDLWSNEDDQEVSFSYSSDETKIYLPPQNVWAEGDNRYQVTYTAGYADKDIPAAINSAIAQLVVREYNNPDGMKSTGIGDMTTNWQALMNSDITDLLTRKSLRRVMR